MIDFNTLVYTGRCLSCGTLNRYIVIVSNDGPGKAESIMQARILRCKICREKVKASRELGSNAPVTKLVGTSGTACDLLVGKNQREIVSIYGTCNIFIDLNELKRTGFLGMVQIRGIGDVESVYHILEDRIVPFHFRDEERDDERVANERPEVVFPGRIERIGISRVRREEEAARMGNE